MRSFRQGLLSDMPAFRTRLAWLEFSCRCFCPHSTSVRDFVAEQLHEQCRGRIEYFPVQSRFLRNVPAGLLDGALGTAGHVVDTEFFHRHEGVVLCQLAGCLMQKVQPLTRLFGTCTCQTAHSLFPALGAALLPTDGLLQGGDFVFAVLIPTRIVESHGLAGFSNAMFGSPIQGNSAMRRSRTFNLLRF